MNRLLILVILTCCCSLTTRSQSNHEVIKSNLRNLAVFVGQWNVTTENISHSGVRSEETGTYEITWALDSTYITRTASLTNTTSNRTRQFVSWLTFDTSVDKFKMVFFYDKRSNQIIEYGTYDQQAMTFTTFTSFEIENGITEYIRHVLDLKDPKRIESRAWIRLDDAEEANNFTAIWNRK